MAEKELKDLLELKIRTTADNIRTTDYIKRRIKELSMDKVPDAEEGMPDDNYILSIPKGNNFNNRKSLLEDSLKLENFEKEILNNLSIIPMNERALKTLNQKANTHIAKSTTLTNNAEATVNGMLSINLDKYDDYLLKSITDANLKYITLLYLSAFSKVIAKSSPDKLFYYRAITANLLNIPVYQYMENEEGIAESKIYLSSINRILNKVKAKITK